MQRPPTHSTSGVVGPHHDAYGGAYLEEALPPPDASGVHHMRPPMPTRYPFHALMTSAAAPDLIASPHMPTPLAPSSMGYQQGPQQHAPPQPAYLATSNLSPPQQHQPLPQGSVDEGQPVQPGQPSHAMHQQLPSQPPPQPQQQQQQQQQQHPSPHSMHAPYVSNPNVSERYAPPFYQAGGHTPLPPAHQHQQHQQLQPSPTMRATTPIITPPTVSGVSSDNPEFNLRDGRLSAEQLRRKYPDFGEKEVRLFEYFRDVQCAKMCVSPVNLFLSILLPLTLHFEAVMFAVLAWAAWHKGGGTELGEEAQGCFDKSLDILRQKPAAQSREENFATLIILAAAKVCSGDVREWQSYLISARDLVLQSNGGFSTIMSSYRVQWLVQWCAYYGILATSPHNVLGLFRLSDYEFMFRSACQSSIPDSLAATCQPALLMIERINALARSLNTGLEDVSDAAYAKAHVYERRIWEIQPMSHMLAHLSEADLQLQLQLFEAFRLATAIHLQQRVFRVNSAALSLRVVAQKLHRTLDFLLGTDVDSLLKFPLFMAGIVSPVQSSRVLVMYRFDAMQQRLSTRNIVNAQQLVRMVWDRDEWGSRYVDWNEVAESEQLRLSFA